ncbi:MAG: PQQ-dependent sugar dehydrogenase, partial [Bdellovibrionales bacterium]|nr:PQQ-dependent sugar dehydrogenase [Bdellovibrionales bacterium]
MGKKQTASMRCVLRNTWMKIGFVAASTLVAGLLACSGGGSSGPYIVEPVLEDANFPISIRSGPEGEIYFTELTSGNVRIMRPAADGTLELQQTPLATVPVPIGTGEGLSGLALDINFATNSYLYVYHTHPSPRRNRLIRLTIHNGRSESERVLLDNIPADEHDGGALIAAPDNTLYLATGDANSAALAQDMTSTAGKILRIVTDGSIPSDNPDPSSPIIASGIRNVFGMDFDARTDTIYFSDNGPDCDDEFNSLTFGSNYGWREEQPCGDSAEGFKQPLTRFNPSMGITAVHVYHGAEFPHLEGRILVADYNTGSIRILEASGTTAQIVGKIISGDYGPILGLSSD